MKGGSMKNIEIETIFTHGDSELSIDANNKLYWNEKEIVTKQEINLQWWVNISIIVAAVSTFGLALIALLGLLSNCGK